MCFSCWSDAAFFPSPAPPTMGKIKVKEERGKEAEKKSKGGVRAIFLYVLGMVLSAYILYFPMTTITAIPEPPRAFFNHRIPPQSPLPVDPEDLVEPVDLPSVHHEDGDTQQWEEEAEAGEEKRTEEKKTEGKTSVGTVKPNVLEEDEEDGTKEEPIEGWPREDGDEYGNVKDTRKKRRRNSFLNRLYRKELANQWTWDVKENEWKEVFRLA